MAASPGNEGFGGHATVFLQLGPEHGAKRIDLTLVDEKIVIRILDADTWADPSLGATKTWQITADAADRALFLAQRFQSNQGDYTYSKLGVGFRRYNCALFAEKILQAAGVAASSGAIASSPGQLVTGKRGPSAELKKPKTPGFDRPGSEASRPKGPPPPLAVPAQYDL